MSFSKVCNVGIKGISASVPKNEKRIADLALFTKDEAEKFSGSTGVYNIRIADQFVTTSDLVYHAANQLINDLNWSFKEIDILIFVSQTPDYILPATSCILQDRLGLNEDAMVLDVSLGCSGWIYGLNLISTMMSSGNFKKGLLLVGDTISKTCNPGDKSAYPLFGDAGTATALEFKESAEQIYFNWGVDGSGAKAIVIPDGGFRNPVSEKSFVQESFDGGILRAPKDLVLEGMDVFSFGINKAPYSVNQLQLHFGIDPESVDYYLFHQANLFMNEKIRKKLKISPEKVPYSLNSFGNTSSASIPLTIVTELGAKGDFRNKKILACGFGVGLSWGSLFFETTDFIVLKNLN